MKLRIPFLVAAALLVVAAPARAQEPQLNARAVVDSGIVTLGDVLDDAGPAADAVIARAPAPGERIVIRVSRIHAVARANGLDWRPLRGIDRVVVSRASQTIGLTQIADHLTNALSAIAPDEKFRVQLSQRTKSIYLPTDVSPTLDVENLSFDEHSGRFSATLVAAPGTNSTVRTDVSGRAVSVVDVPVLRRGVKRGDIIVELDIGWTEVPVERLPAAIVTDPADLVGLAAQRSLRPGKPVRASEVGPPVEVAKGANVIMTYRTPAMVLTTSGRALESGAMGDTIRVLNTKTNTVIQARVEGGNLVTVTTRQNVALN